MKTNTIETIPVEALDAIIGGRGKVLTAIFGPDATTAWNEYMQSGGKKRSFQSAEEVIARPFSWF